MCYLIWLDLLLLKKLDYQKEKLSRLMQQCISQSKLSTTKAEEAINEPATKKEEILP